MARKHTVKKETKTEFNADSGNFSITETEEHLIVDDTPHTFLADEISDDEMDLMFLGSKRQNIIHPHAGSDSDIDAEPSLIIRVDDDGFW